MARQASAAACPRLAVSSICEFVRAAKCVGENISLARGHGSRPRVADDENPHEARLPAGIVRIVVAQDADERDPKPVAIVPTRPSGRR